MDSTQKEDKTKKGNILKNKTFKSFIRLCIKIIVLVIIYYVFFGVFIGLKKMDTSFMSPNITEGDLLIFYRMDRNFELGDVVLIDINEKNSVYRIVAKEGQTIDISENGKLLIDGFPEEIQVFYATDKDEDSNIVFPYTIEEGRFFVMNDYRVEKNDSRVFGTISANSIIGKIIGRLQIRNI